MSTADAALFLEKARTDVRLQHAIEALVRQQGGFPVISGAQLAALAREHGIQFTTDELHELVSADPHELTDADLEQVTGGQAAGRQHRCVGVTLRGGRLLLEIKGEG